MKSDTPAEIIIPLSKNKIVLLLFGAVVFVAGSVWMWSIADSQNRHSPLFMKSVAAAGGLFFGLCGIYGGYKLFDTRPGLIIDDQGLIDNSSAVAVGRIPWDDIAALRLSVIAGQRLISILLTEPEKYASRGNLFGRMLNATSAKMTGSPINIASIAVRIDFDELVQVLTDAFERHRPAESRTAADATGE